MASPLQNKGKRLRYLLFHKPFGVLCQFTDSPGAGDELISSPEKTKTHSPRPCLKDFISVTDIYACGRLDWDSEGLLLLTNDGALIHALTAPISKLPKTYWVQVEGIPNPESLSHLEKGVLIEGKKTLPAKAKFFPEGDEIPERKVPIRFRKNIPTCWISLSIVEGRNRQVRKMTAAIGHPTLRLIRSSIGPFSLEGLELGKWKEISSMEIQQKLSTFKKSF